MYWPYTAGYVHHNGDEVSVIDECDRHLGSKYIYHFSVHGSGELRCSFYPPSVSSFVSEQFWFKFESLKFVNVLMQPRSLVKLKEVLCTWYSCVHLSAMVSTCGCLSIYSTDYSADFSIKPIRQKKKLCLFPVTCLKILGSVGRENLFFNFLLVPYRWNRGGTLGFLAVRHSVRLSICPSVSQSVCQSTWCPSTLFSELFSVVLWDIDLKFGMLICLDIIQIKFEFRHAWPTVSRSYCPLLKFSFPCFSLPSFEILTWNLIYEFVLTQYKSSLSFVTLDLLL